MYSIENTTSFRKDYKLCNKRGYELPLLKEIVKLLENGLPIPAINKPHLLTGNYKGYWECHVKPDWLLVWKVDKKNKIIYLTRTGTHSDIF